MYKKRAGKGCCFHCNSLFLMIYSGNKNKVEGEDDGSNVQKYTKCR